jgi:hypothetical protein
MEIATSMKISIPHHSFAERLNDQTALERPELFLGPNWKNVLNFWIYLDTLSVEDFRLIEDPLDVSNTIRSLTWKAAEYTIGVKYAYEAWYAVPTTISDYATLELIASHNLESFKFLPLFLNP